MDHAYIENRNGVNVPIIHMFGITFEWGTPEEYDARVSIFATTSLTKDEIMKHMYDLLDAACVAYLSQ